MLLLQTSRVTMPAIGLGTWDLRGRACRDTVAEALRLGYRHLDTAQMYRNEDQVGAGLAASGVDRDEVFVVTKIDNHHHAADRVRRSTEDSLRALGLDHVDLLLVHWPVEWDRIGETLGAMRELQEAGKVRHLGVSNFSPSQLEEALTHAPVVANQIKFSPYEDVAADLEAAAAHDVVVTAYTPLEHGRVSRDPVLRQIAERHGCTAAQVALRWLLDHPRVAVIPKASSRGHLEENLAAAAVQLDDEDRAAIAALA